jgi:hypothetical protein
LRRVAPPAFEMILTPAPADSAPPLPRREG